MECSVDWSGTGLSFNAITGSGHAITLDGAAEHGGLNRGARPMELLLVGAAGCSAFDVLLILQRGRHAVAGCTVTVTAERAQTDPKVFTRILMTFRLRGEHLSRAAVERAVKLSREKYCSATAMLVKTAVIETAIELV